jgi:hypothetical protein
MDINSLSMNPGNIAKKMALVTHAPGALISVFLNGIAPNFHYRFIVFAFSNGDNIRLRVE